MLDYLKSAGYILLAWSMIAIMVASALDALEYETTGECQGCIILTHLKQQED